MVMLTTDAQVIDDKADWLLVFEAALRVGSFSSFDTLLHHALNAWLEQLTPELRWKIAKVSSLIRTWCQSSLKSIASTCCAGHLPQREPAFN